MANRYKILHSGMDVVSSSAQIDYTQIQNKPTSIESASYAATAAFALNIPETASHAIIADTASYYNLPAGVVSSSAQAVSWSVATASYALNTPTLPEGLVSSSAQIDYTDIQNKPTTIATASYVNTADTASYYNLPSGIVSSSAQVLNGSNVYSSSAQLPTGIVSGSSQIANWSVATASYALNIPFANVSNKPSLVSSSAQIDYTQIQNKPTTIATASYVTFTNVANKPSLVSSSAQIAGWSVATASYATYAANVPATASHATVADTASYYKLPSGIVSSSAQIDYNGIQNKPTTIATASYVTFTNVANKPSLVSSSAQIDYAGIQNKPTSIATASYVLNAISSSYAPTKAGVVSASAQIDYNGIQNKPTTIATASYVTFANVANKPSLVSSSLQFKNTDNVTFGQITASAINVQTLVTTTISASVEYASGSTRFGSQQSNTHQFTGSILATGSLFVNGHDIGTSAARTIVGTTDQVIVANGDGIAGNPTLSLPQSIATSSKPIFAGATLATGPTQFATALDIQESTHATSRRAGLNLGKWMFFQDPSGDGTRSFCLYDSLQGAQRLVVDTSGNVGIGTTTPAYKLDVSGSIGSLSQVNINGAAASFRVLQYLSNGNRRINVGTDGSAESGSNSGANFQINTFDDSGNFLATAMLIRRSTGNVGIGTTAPQASLHVGGGTETNTATYGGAIKTYTATNTSLESVGGIELPVATDGYGVKIQALSAAGSALAFANRNGAATWTERMRIAANGNVGIGTTAPNERFTVGGSGTFGMGFQQDSTTIAAIKPNTITGEVQHFATTNYFPTFYSNNVERMRIDANGNVGIGASAPESTAKLYIADSAYSRVHFVNGSGGYAFFGLSDITTSNGLIDCTNSLRVSINGSEKMRINGNGNVGINTTSPSGILDVAKPSSGGRVQVVNEGADSYNVVASRNSADSAYLPLTMRTTGLVVGSPSAGVIQQIQAPGETRMFVTNTTASIACQVGASPSGTYVGSYTAHPLELRTSDTPRVIVGATGNVGVNNTKPLRKLDVVGDSNGNGIRVTGTTGTIGAFTAEGTSVNIQADSAAATRILIDAGTLNASGYAVMNGGSSGYVQLGTGGTPKLQVFASGIVKLNSYGAGTLVTDSSGNVTATSALSVASVSASGAVSAASVSTTGNISAAGTMTVNSGASPAGTVRNITISTAAPSGGADGDVWLQYTA